MSKSKNVVKKLTMILFTILFNYILIILTIYVISLL